MLTRLIQSRLPSQNPTEIEPRFFKRQRQATSSRWRPPGLRTVKLSKRQAPSPSRYAHWRIRQRLEWVWRSVYSMGSWKSSTCRKWFLFVYSLSLQCVGWYADRMIQNHFRPQGFHRSVLCHLCGHQDRSLKNHPDTHFLHRTYIWDCQEWGEGNRWRTGSGLVEGFKT